VIEIKRNTLEDYCNSKVIKGGAIMSGVTSSRTKCIEQAVPLLCRSSEEASDGQGRSRLRAALSLASLLTASTAAAQEGASSGLSLPTIDINSDKTGGYQVSEPSLTRLPLPILDIPQSVNVVPQQVIQDQNVGNVKDVLRNIAGISFRAGEGGNQGDTPYIRGFSAQSDVFRDGVRDPGWYTRDTFAVDAVEVYKGPAAVLFGRGSTGGVINLVSKTPFERNLVEGTVTGNTGPGMRATLDANGKVAEGTWARVVTMGQLYDYGATQVGQRISILPGVSRVKACNVIRDAPFALAFPLHPVRTVRLVTLRRGNARIARRLRWLVQFRLKLDNPCRQNLQLRPQRMDQRILLLVRKPRKIGKRRQWFHPQVESIKPTLVNLPPASSRQRPAKSVPHAANVEK